MSLFCRWIEARLPLFVGGDLGLRATRFVRGHLQRCSSCHGVYQSFRRSYVALHRVGDAHEPEAVASEFWPELKRRLHGDRRPLARLLGGGSRFSGVRRAAVAAGVLVAFGAGFFIGDPTVVSTFRGGSGGAGAPAGSRPQALDFGSDRFVQPVNHVTPRNVGSYYFPEMRVVRPKSRVPDRLYPAIPVRTAGGSEDDDGPR